MDHKTFEGIRWTVVYGKYEGVEAYAVNELYKVIQQFVPFTLTVKNASAGREEISCFSIVFIGTAESNQYIKEFAEKGIISLNTKKEGYSIKILPSPFNEERKIIILAGADENGTLYAVRDFEHYYSDPARYLGEYYYDCYKVFLDKMPDFEMMSAPAFENRGLWSWGQVIYDYRRYLDNMSKWKMNMLTIWNDFAPLNAKEVVECAHARGIKVIWGFSWCWGVKVDPTDENERKKWTEIVLNIYEKEYEPLGVDGIYFQTFTEHEGSKIKERSTAALVTDWVNHIAGKLLEKHPGLWIQFGLHGGSVKEDYAEIANIDPRLNITWEDAGCFPYHYNPKLTDQFAETLDFTGKICTLRGKNEDFGMVVKGLSILHWPTNEHQRGTFVMGETNEGFIRNRAIEKEELWKYNQTWWIKNIKYVLDTFRLIKNRNTGKVSIVGLVEDGIWEEHMWSPVALLAESLWNPDEEADELVRKVSLVRDSALRVLDEIGIQCSHWKMIDVLSQKGRIRYLNGRIHFNHDEMDTFFTKKKVVMTQKNTLEGSQTDFSMGGSWNCIEYCDPANNYPRVAAIEDSIMAAKLSESLGAKGCPIPVTPGDINPRIKLLLLRK